MFHGLRTFCSHVELLNPQTIDNGLRVRSSGNVVVVFVSVLRFLNKSFAHTSEQQQLRPPTEQHVLSLAPLQRICCVSTHTSGDTFVIFTKASLASPRRVFGHYCGSLSHRIRANMERFEHAKEKRLCFWLNVDLERRRKAAAG